MKKFCKRKNCDHAGKYRHAENCFFCPKHYRFRQMRHKAQQNKKYVPTWDECDILLYIWCPNFKCLICNVKLEWHADINGLKNVISLQHNNDKTVIFICQGCNAAHGHSRLGDYYFKVPLNKKYCPRCDKILLKNNFSKNVTRRDNLHGYCRKCNSLCQKERINEKQRRKM